jgi:hypothetical protein
MGNYMMYKGVLLTHSNNDEVWRIKMLIDVADCIDENFIRNIKEINDHKGDLTVTVTVNEIHYSFLQNIIKAWENQSECNVGIIFEI